jgi:hypothetical protein
MKMSQPPSNDTLRFSERLRIDTGVNAICLSGNDVHFQLNNYTSSSNTRTAKEQKVLITNTLRSVLYNAILLLSSVLPTTTDKFAEYVEQFMKVT